jgi:hypothetical protein
MIPDVDRRHVQRRQAFGDYADHGAAAHHLEVGGVQGFVADLDAPCAPVAFHAGRDFIFWIKA